MQEIKDYIKVTLACVALVWVFAFMAFGMNYCTRAVFEHGVYYADPDDMTLHKNTCTLIIDNEHYYDYYEDYAEARRDGYEPCARCLKDAILEADVKSE